MLQYLEGEGVVKLGEFEVQDAVALKAFAKDSFLTIGADHFDVRRHLRAQARVCSLRARPCARA